MGYTPSFTPQYENGWEDLPIEETPITAEALNAYDDAIENIEEYLASDESQANLADAYDETATYEAGDYVIYGGDLYKCLEDIDTPEEWDSTKWESCLITNEMGHGGGGGSNVSITPTLSTGTKIADFEIDGESGELYAPTGGGNANIWTGTQAEYEQQASQIPDDTVVLITDDEEHTQAFDIYSTNEQVIGTYVDGKPIYRKSFTYASGSLSTGTMTLTNDLSNIERVIDKHCQFHGGSDNRDYDIPYFRLDYNESVFLLCHVLNDSTVSLTLLSGDHSSYTNLTNIVVTLEYTKTTD